MYVTGAIMVPHPPLIIPEVGRGQELAIQATIDAYHKAAEKLKSWEPETVVVLSPHTVMYADYFHISPGAGASGDFGQFGAPQVKLDVRYDTELVEALAQEAGRCGIPAGTLGERERRLDHGTMIPLWFLNKYYTDYRVVRMGLSGLAFSTHYELGQCIRKAADSCGRRIAVIGSGDLSHRLKEDGPYGFRKEGPEYDRRIMDVMGRGDCGKLLEFAEGFCEKAAECGHRSFVIMAGALDCLEVKAEPLSYEGTFGVGYGVCTYEVMGEGVDRDFLSQYEERMMRDAEKSREEEDAYVALARRSVETYVKTGRKMDIPTGLPDEMYERRAGAFVSLKEEGRLRGCIGTIAPVRPSLAEEIIENAVSAAARDPRFPEVKAGELGKLVYSVDVLGEPEEISSPEQLDVKRYGVIVTQDHRRGLLLPDLEGVDTVEQQISIAKMKAGIDEEATDVRLERFEVVRHF